jgi:hypothetical protein
VRDLLRETKVPGVTLADFFAGTPPLPWVAAPRLRRGSCSLGRRKSDVGLPFISSPARVRRGRRVVPLVGRVSADLTIISPPPASLLFVSEKRGGEPTGEAHSVRRGAHSLQPAAAISPSPGDLRRSLALASHRHSSVHFAFTQWDIQPRFLGVPATPRLQGRVLAPGHCVSPGR